MKCNICGSTEAKIRPIDVSIALHSLKAHVDCAGHSQYRTVGRDDVQEAQRLLDAAPEMLKLLQKLAVGYDEDDGQGIYQRIDDFIDFTHEAQALIAKIKGRWGARE